MTTDALLACACGTVAFAATVGSAFTAYKFSQPVIRIPSTGICAIALLTLVKVCITYNQTTGTFSGESEKKFKADLTNKDFIQVALLAGGIISAFTGSCYLAAGYRHFKKA